MSDFVGVGIVLAALVGSLLGLAPRVSTWLVRSRARRLPGNLSARLHEEWLAELGALPGRPSQLAFAIALTLTGQHSFAIEDATPFAVTARSPIAVAAFGGWRSVVMFMTVFVAAIAYAASFLIQPLYQSRAHVLVVPQRVSSRLVAPAIRASLNERVHAFNQTALSRQRLESVVLQFDLYQSKRGPQTIERDNVRNGMPTSNRPRASDAAIERMRQDISITVHADGQSFELAYISPDPHLAMRVTERLTSLVIEANLRDREDLTQLVGVFLDAQINDVRSRLLARAGLTSSPPANPSEGDVQALEHETLRTTYRDLLMKKEQALMSANLERRQIGEQFKLLDPARTPEAPLSPDRTRLTLLGAGVGFCLGVAMMFAGRHGTLRRPKKVLAQ